MPRKDHQRCFRWCASHLVIQCHFRKEWETLLEVWQRLQAAMEDVCCGCFLRMFLSVRLSMFASSQDSTLLASTFELNATDIELGQILSTSLTQVQIALWVWSACQWFYQGYLHLGASYSNEYWWIPIRSQDPHFRRHPMCVRIHLDFMLSCIVILISLAATFRAPWVLSLQNGRVRTRPARGTIRKALNLAFEDNSTYQLASYIKEKS